MMSIHDCKSMNKVSVSIQETTYELPGITYANLYTLNNGSVVSCKAVAIPKSHQSICPNVTLLEVCPQRINYGTPPL